MFKVSAIIHSNEFDEFFNFTIGHNLLINGSIFLKASINNKWMGSSQ